MRQLPLALSLPPQPTLDNFVPGANGELVARLRAAAAGALGEGVLYLWGDAGCGRSHLLRATVRAAGADAAYFGCDAQLAPGSARLVAVDDVDRCDEPRQAVLFSLINRARDTGGTVLAAGPTPPAQLGLREDLKTRLAWGLVYRVRPLDDEGKAQHLRAEARRRGLELSDEVVAYLLRRLPRELRYLVAVLDRLDEHSLARARPITLPLAREALGDVPGAAAANPGAIE